MHKGLIGSFWVTECMLANMAHVDLKMVCRQGDMATYTQATPVCALVKNAYIDGGSVRGLQWSEVRAGKARMCW